MIGGAALAAHLADEARLEIGQAGVVGPLIRGALDGVAAPLIGAIDQDAADAHRAHLAEGDLLRAIHGLSAFCPHIRIALRD